MKLELQRKRVSQRTWSVVLNHGANAQHGCRTPNDTHDEVRLPALLPVLRSCFTHSFSGPPKKRAWSSADIVSACFALPFERRLILGTEDGKLLLVNYVTGAILDEMQPHTAEVVYRLACWRRVA